MENNCIEPLEKEEVKLLKIYRVLSTEQKNIIQDLITVWNSLYEQKNEEELKGAIENDGRTTYIN